MTENIAEDRFRDLRDLLTPKRQQLEKITNDISAETKRYQLEKSVSEATLTKLNAERFAFETDINTIEQILGSPNIPKDSIKENDESPFGKSPVDRHSNSELLRQLQDQQLDQQQDQQHVIPSSPSPTRRFQQKQELEHTSDVSPYRTLPFTPCSPQALVRENKKFDNNYNNIEPASLSGPPGLPASHSVHGWARSTHFVMSLLWHSKVNIPECSLFDENSAIQDHLFVGQTPNKELLAATLSSTEDNGDQHPISGSRVLRSTRDNTTLSHIFKRLHRKATTPLCAVNRAVGTHGQVLSAAGFNLLLDELRAKLNRPSKTTSPRNRGYLNHFDDDLHRTEPAEEEECNDFCIQQYIEPLNGIRYEVTCTRHGSNNNDNNDETNVLSIDVVPSNYANYYTYPDNYRPSTQFQQRKVAPPSADLRQRMVTSAMSVLRHAEVAHDVRMVHVVLEMIVAVNKSVKGSSSLSSMHQKNRKFGSGGGGGGGGVGVVGARRVEVYVTGASEAHWIMAPGGWRTLRAAPKVVRGRGAEARMEADIAFEASGYTDFGGDGVDTKNKSLCRSESAPALEMSLNIRRQARNSHSHHQLLPYQQTIHAASGSHLTIRKAFGPTSNQPSELRSSGLLLSKLPSNNFAAPDKDPFGTERHHNARVGDDKGMVLGNGGLLTNIRVARDGPGGHDELHVQMSKELRNAKDREKKQQEKIDMLVAKEDDHLSKIAGLEAAHARIRKTLRTTESNLETYAMEAKQRIESLQSMLVSTQHKLTGAQADAARERALRIQNVKKLENAQNEHRVLQIRHDELVSRLALVADMEKNGTAQRLAKEKLEHDHAALISTNEKLMSEAEELRQRLGMAEEELIQQRALRKALYMLMGDTRTPGVRPPKRVAGGYSTYARPCKRNVAKAVKLIVDGEIAEAWKNKPKPRKREDDSSGSGHLRSLRALKESREALNGQTPNSPGGTVDTPSVVKFLKNMFGKRTLYGKKIKNASGMFKLIDRDHSGEISRDELLDALIRLDSGLSNEQIETLVNTFDDDQNGQIDYQEFVQVFNSKGRTR